MSIIGNMVGCYSSIGKTFIIVDEDGNEIPGVVVEQEQIFDATPSDVKENKVFASDDGVQVGTAAMGVDGSDVTFGYVDGAPVERESAYIIDSEKLNELGAIVQQMAGKTKLVTVDEMITLLRCVEYIPHGNAESDITLRINDSAIGINPNAQLGRAASAITLKLDTNAEGDIVI